MSLSLDKLRTALTRLFIRPDAVATHTQAEARLAAAYHEYAADVEDASGDSATNLDPGKFQMPLDFAREGTPQSFARQLDRAFTAYWTGTAFGTSILIPAPPPDPPCPNSGGTGVFGAEFSSVVVDVDDLALFTAVLPVVQRPSDSAQAQAARLAQAMDTVTKTAITVIISGTDTTPGLAISNTCGVF